MPTDKPGIEPVRKNARPGKNIMQEAPDEKLRIGPVIKAARLSKGIRQEALAEKLDISPRHLMGIEKGNKTPSLKLLYAIVRELNIPADSIFYPEIAGAEPKLSGLTRLLSSCDERWINLIYSTVSAMLDNLPED